MRQWTYPVDRPLRSDPVRREEVLIETQHGQLHLWTMPLGTYRIEKRYGLLGPGLFFIGDPGLWKPLLDELAVWAEAELKRSRELQERHPSIVQAFGLGPPSLLELPKLEFYLEDSACELDCRVCGVRFLRNYRDRVTLRTCACSNHCRDQWQNTVRANWRKHNSVNASRGRKRAQARAGRSCAHCGTSIEATRSTRRFCSDICRVRSHHERARAHRDQPSC